MVGMSLMERVRKLVEEELENTSYFIVDVIGGEGSKKIGVLLDGEQGISIDVCAKISRSISKIIDEDEFELEAFILEVSSPGADTPMKDFRQYAQHVGRNLEVTLKTGEKLRGKMSAIGDGELTLEPMTKKGKKKTVKSGKRKKENNNQEHTDITEPTNISFEEIEESVVMLSFK